MKKAYKDDPIFSKSKVVLSLYEDFPTGSFDADFAQKALFGGVTEKDVDLLKSPDGINLAKTAARFSDGVILASENIPTSLVSYCRDRGLAVLKSKPKSIADGSYIDEYNAFYDQLVK